MKRRIFVYMCLVALCAAISTLLISWASFYMAGESWITLAKIWPYSLLSVFLGIMLSYFAAQMLTRRIVTPLNQLPIDKPGNTMVYEELSPLLERITRQSRDIHEQMQTLRQKQREFAVITENMSEGFLVIGKNAEILSYNKSVLLQLGAEIADFAEKSVFALNRSETFRKAVEHALSGRKSELTMEKNGRFYSLIASPVREEGEVVGAVLLVLDVTERRERENLRREFTTNVSHELKTPLTSISGFAEIMQSGLVRQEDIARFAGKIYDEAQRLITLVGDIIKLSQLDENSVPFERQPVELAELAEKVIRHLEDTAASKSVTFYRTGTPVTVMGVPNILEEMIFNLCDNAVKYNREKGSVTVTTGQNEHGVFLSVADTGIGIPPSQQDRVFERFYRAEKSHSKEIDGTGLGLSIVKHGAAFHRASVSLESTEGIGTTVTITWPPAAEK
ncbi:MAG TPA: PAS domain-containing protein [Clostridiales bacterium]|nr:PAS domain-containing protein [Clostridiales bacterium]